MFTEEKFIFPGKPYPVRLSLGQDIKMQDILPMKCEKCNIDLHVDYQFVRDTLGRNVRLWCRNGHSVIVALSTNLKMAIDLEKEKILERESKSQSHRPHSRNRSVVCDVCKVRIYNAGPNQKRHDGECARRHNRQYWTKWGKNKRRLQQAS